MSLRYDCPASYCLSHFSGRWKPLLLSLIEHQINRFGAMRRSLPGISKQTLARQLRELENCGVLRRDVYPGIRQQVVYSLTERGASLQPILKMMRCWGEERMERSQDAMSLQETIESP